MDNTFFNSRSYLVTKQLLKIYSKFTGFKLNICY